MTPESEWQGIFDSISDAVCLLDKTHAIIRCNRAMQRLCRLNDKNMVGKMCWEIIHGRKEKHPDCPVSEMETSLVRSGRDMFIQNKWYRVTADPIFDEKGELYQIVHIIRDIHDEKKAREELAIEKERLAVTLTSIGDGVITTDLAGAILLMNPVAEQLTGWSSAEAAGQLLPAVFNIVNEFTRVACVNPVERVLKEGKIVELANHTMLISRQGREYIIADSGAPIRNAKGEVMGVVLVFHDTTEKERMLEHIQRAQKLESVGTLAGGIAHDFNNMLAGIFGYIDIARKGLDLDDIPRAQSAIFKALGVFDRARALTKQLLTFSKGGAPIRRAQLIEPLLRHSTQFALTGSNVSVNFKIAPDLWPCDIDENQIEQVLDNLLINAKHAMPQGGVVSVTAENIKIERDRDGLLPQGGEFVKITVSDNGCGIPKEAMPRIFDPFFTTKTQAQGLGLATVHSIISKHGGSIIAESEPGRGTCFIFHLPASQGPAPRIASQPAPSKIHKSRGTILVMDDDEGLRDITMDRLNDFGFSAFSAKEGGEAVALVAAAIRDKKPYIGIILDLTVPGGMGGKEAVVEIRKLDAAVPVIAFSGYADHPVMANPKAYGFSASLRKPYREVELLELLDTLIPPE